MGVADLLDISGGPGLSVMEALAEARRRLAVQWLNTPVGAARQHWEQELGQLHQLLSQGIVRDRLPTDADAPILRRINEIIGQPIVRDIGPLLAAMLFYDPHELPCIFPLEQVPNWFTQGYLPYMQFPPQLLRHVGGADAYESFLRRWLGYLHERIAAQPQNASWRNIAVSTASSMNMVTAYFSSRNLRQLMTLRARILEQATTATGADLDYRFAPRPAGA